MKKTVQIRIGNTNPTVKFDTELDIKVGDKVIVETANGSEWGVVATIPAESNKNQNNNLILRTANKFDEKTIADLEAAAEHAMKAAAEKVEKLKLDMKLLSAHYTLDSSKVIFQFYSENRVDFRELVRELAYSLRARIELRQVGARDEAKIIGAVGQCGMQCCCGRFLEGFENITIKMAKNQNISLNPQRINGMCGRLLCCLAYENDYYAEMQEKMPRTGSEVQTPDGKGIVQDTNMLKQTVNVKVQNGDIGNFKCYNLCDVKCKNCGKREGNSNK